MLKHQFRILALVIFLYACGSVSAPKEVTEDSLEYYPLTPREIPKSEFRELFRNVKGFYDTTLLRTGFNGGFLVAKGGNIVYEAYNGMARLNTTDTIKPNTPFHIASTSKTFTSAAVLYLVDKKQLSLNDSIQTFFPGFPYKNISVKTLLSQRSGLPNYMNAMEESGWDRKKIASNNDVLQFFMKGKAKLYYPSGTRFNYSNTNFVLLALIIEKVSGKSYASFLKEIFFTPLQMNDTYVYTHADSARATPSYRWNGVMEGYTWMDETVGDKNIYSTPRDLLKWDQSLYSHQILSAAIKDSAFKPYSFEKPGIHNYGLGWRMYTLPQNKTIVYHNGWWHGNNSCFYRVTSDSLTIIVLGNKMNQNIYRIKPLIEKLTDLRFSYDDE
ncbi:MAG TPA: serine hydrolase domain-containing protein [Lacibacter sp.]|nr:serine hydrolase domain-containing protein [Lacibacter sp.]